MKICILGSGNVAHHLSKALYNAGHQIIQVYSRNAVTAKKVAKRVEAPYVSDIDGLDKRAQLYILCVNDDSIDAVVKEFPFRLSSAQCLAHTAGSVSIDSLASVAESYGSFYPLQTFSISRRISFRSIPICIDGSDMKTISTLQKVASSISTDVRSIDEFSRRVIHLSAVFSCNFSNHMIALAESILKDHDIAPDIIHPLIQETISKAIAKGANSSQTGPAIRADHDTMDAHLSLLQGHEELSKMYKIISQSINSFHS